MLAHCRMLSVACNYTEGEHMVCVLDFKRETGLWHAVLASVLNGMHVIFIPYALMKVSPASWMHMITKYRSVLTDNTNIVLVLAHLFTEFKYTSQFLARRFISLKTLISGL